MQESHGDRLANESDRRLRSALEPPPESVQRVLRRALEPSITERGGRPSNGLKWGLAAAMVLVIGVGLFAWRASLRLRVSLPPTARLASAPPPLPLLTITNRSGVVTLETPDGSATLVVIRAHRPLP